MKQLIAPTEPFIRQEIGVLNADVAAGTDVTLTLVSNDGLADNDFLVIGHEGSELAEMEQINATVSGNTDVQVATLKFAHKKGEPVVKYRYNKRKFYGAETETGSYTELTAFGSPAQIQVDDPQGTLCEYTASTYSWFKATYYNTETLEESDIADATAVEADESARYTSIYNIRVHCGLVDNPYISDGRIEIKRKQAENEVNSAIYALYSLPLDEVPPLIENITTLLAAGYIDFEEFGKDGEGVKWLGEARGLLKAIKDGRQNLIGADGTEINRRSNTGRLSGYPDGTTESSGEGFMFTRDQVF